MTTVEKIEQIAFPIINEEFKKRIPKETSLETRVTISSTMSDVAYLVYQALEKDPTLDIEEVTKRELKITFSEK